MSSSKVLSIWIRSWSRLTVSPAVTLMPAMRPSAGRLQANFHFHRFKQQQCLVFFDRIAGRDIIEERTSDPASVRAQRVFR